MLLPSLKELILKTVWCYLHIQILAKNFSARYHLGHVGIGVWVMFKMDFKTYMTLACGPNLSSIIQVAVY
jgi:hypothetical protein